MGILDAGTSSLGNLALALAGAHLLDAGDFGLLAATMATTIIIVGFVRVLLLDAYTLGYGGSLRLEKEAAGRRLLGAASAVAVLIAGSSIAAGLVVGGNPGRLLVLVGVVLPGSVVIDTVRGIAYTMSNPERALLATVVSTSIAISGVVTLALCDRMSVVAASMLWGAGALIGAIAALRVARLIPQTSQCGQWLREAWSVGRRSSLDYIFNQAIGLGGGLLIAALAGSTEYGYLRIAQLPFAPAQVIVTGCIAFLQPAMVARVAHGDPRGARRLAAGGAAGIIAFVLVSAAVVVIAPGTLLERVFGARWHDAAQFLPVVGGALAASALAATYGPYLRAVGLLTFEVVVKAAVAPVVLIAMALFARGGDAVGAAAAQACGLGAIASCAVAASVRSARVRAAVGSAAA